MKDNVKKCGAASDYLNGDWRFPPIAYLVLDIVDAVRKVCPIALKTALELM